MFSIYKHIFYYVVIDFDDIFIFLTLVNLTKMLKQ